MSAVQIPGQRQPRSHHQVHLYASDAGLLVCVLAFLSPALASGRPALVVATPDHRALFADGLAGAGIDVATLRHQGVYVELDAEQTLACFTRDGRLDPDAFHRSVGARLGSQARRHGPVAVYGEMVALLWDTGHAACALTLEHLWNDLAVTLPFRLCCAYPTSTVEQSATTDQVDEMLRTHTASTSG